MGKVKTFKTFAIDWVENVPGQLTGAISNDGPSMASLVKEMKSIPVDVPKLRSKLVTEEIQIKFGKNFSTDRKDEFLKEVQKLYPTWRMDIPEDKESLLLYPDFEKRE